MRIVRRVAEVGGDRRLDPRGDVVLEALGLDVHDVPWQLERLGEKQLQQPVPADDAQRDALAPEVRRTPWYGSRATSPAPSSRLSMVETEAGLTSRRSARSVVRTAPPSLWRLKIALA